MSQSNHPDSSNNLLHLGSFSDFFKGILDALSLNPRGAKFIAPVIGTLTLVWVGIELSQIFLPQKLFLAAGQEGGESYIISKALSEVLNKRQCTLIQWWDCYRIQLEVEPTKGTDENLELLEKGLNCGKDENQSKGKISKETRKVLCKVEGFKHAHLAAAQADIAFSTVAQKPDSQARTIATLYQDAFQLIISSSRDEKDDLNRVNSFSEFAKLLKEKGLGEILMDVPKSGGQRTSLESIISHFEEFSDEDFKKILKDSSNKSKDSSNVSSQNALTEELKNDYKKGIIRAVFRVRAIGNSEINELLKLEPKGRLIPIDQAAAMRVRNPAYQADLKIPVGAYEGDAPELNSSTTDGLPTIGVQRLLVVRKDVNERVVRTLTAILNERQAEIIEAIKEPKEDSVEKPKKDSVPIASLVSNIAEPDIKTTGLHLHPGAVKFYKRTPPWVVEHSREILSFVSLVASALLILQKRRKDKADVFINDAVRQMGLDPDQKKRRATFKEQLSYLFFPQETEIRSQAPLSKNTSSTGGNEFMPESFTPEQSQGKLRKWQARLRWLNESLKEDRITFREMLRIWFPSGDRLEEALPEESQGDALETELEPPISQAEVDSPVEANQPLPESPTREQLKGELKKWQARLNRLNEIFNEARSALDNEEISQASFRTFNEAYKSAREFIEHKIEDQQRSFSSLYIRELIDLLEPNQPKAALGKQALLQDIEQKLIDARRLLDEGVFSRESFRTFIETCNLARETINSRI
jgi:TRAP-type uncharacterized transport system substrate-binding protein